ncbi:right-handed parallel beta-helix repeat-containing protein, partial [Candidatus Woesearchaeota archaeon]|nr:right-handed parallel beta-helix repeat-containing protein [Candidatus Woesearchaeota archaeon]
IAGNNIHNVEYDGSWIVTDTPPGATPPSVIERNRIALAGWNALELSGAHNLIVRFNTIATSAVCISILSSLGVKIENNTIDGLGSDGIIIDQASNPLIGKNIISRILYAVECIPGASPMFECNNIYDAYRRYQGCADQTGSNGNIAVDPEFCGIDDSGNYFLQSDSPCAPGNHPDGYDCGLIGAFEVLCGKVEVLQKSWGSIKSLYKEGESHDK